MTGRKFKRRKRSYLPGWVGRHKTTTRRANRRDRHQAKVELRP